MAGSSWPPVANSQGGMTKVSLGKTGFWPLSNVGQSDEMGLEKSNEGLILW